MLKSELIEIMADEFDYFSREEIETVIQIIFESLIFALKHNERIEIRGFGSFAIKKRKPRKARNPKTGASVLIPEKLIPFFTPGKKLRENMNIA